MSETNIIRRKIRVYGVVQGIGFRPFVARLARSLMLAGDVCNKGSYVEIHVEGTEESVNSFRERLLTDAPKVSAIVHTQMESEEPLGEKEFRILTSVHEDGEIFVSPDLAICPDCQRELFDPHDRRYLHPFINCTNCGPRLTILDSMPYDRVRTSMGEFPMCPECEYEYTHQETRRYHAQPVCCNDCGPTLTIYTRKNNWKPVDSAAGVRIHASDSVATVRTPASDSAATLRMPAADAAGSLPDSADRQAIRLARQILREGGIVAIKGIGGFHLACDAANEAAVERLRTLKHRPMKPFAVMMRDLTTVRRECMVPPDATPILDGVQKPILLLPKNIRKFSSDRNPNIREYSGDRHRGNEPRLAEAVAPGGNPNVGVMLPYAPVQLLLFKEPDGLPMTDMLVMTSGNPSGAPICRTTEDALKYLSPMCDAILTNNRKIRLRADDSVMQFTDGRPYMIRRSRGYAPLPVVGPKDWKGTALGIGGELKNTFCLVKDELYYPSPYIGDLADLRSVDALRSAIIRMETLLETKPAVVGCDLHPRYNSTAVARDLGLPIVTVQHHYAHVLSSMAENGVTAPVIGISFDGTGYGTDGTIWGGEFLISTPRGFVRLGSIEPFRQAGGDISSREGWRIAVSLLFREAAQDLFGKWRPFSPAEKQSLLENVLPRAQHLGLCDENALRMQFLMLTQNINTVTSTSAGRLFDAASAILGIRRSSTFEGEASMALEFAADPNAPALVVPDLQQFVEPSGAYNPVVSAQSGVQQLINPKDSGQGVTAVEKLLHGERIKAEGMGVSERTFMLGTNKLIHALREGMKTGQDVSRLAGGFHTSLTEAILAGAQECRRQTGLTTVALTGGCFQNLLLLGKTKRLLEAEGFHVLTHSLIPTNDGGICLGQAIAAMESQQ